jgi:hypothetical protein
MDEGMNRGAVWLIAVYETTIRVETAANSCGIVDAVVS